MPLANTMSESRPARRKVEERDAHVEEEKRIPLRVVKVEPLVCVVVLLNANPNANEVK
jgi:hypothetical protein